MDKKKWIKHIPLFILELIVLIAAAGALYVVLRTTGKNGVKKDRIDTEHIAVNDEVKEKIQEEENGEGEETKTYTGVYNIAFFGVDARDENLGKGNNRSDTIMLCSIDMDKHDVTYENSQARERTQVLMDIANEVGGLVIGTGDMSELALGWATYNGDHMSMYGVNGSVPKTLVRHLVRYYADTCNEKELADVLLDVLDTPVSPELLPPEDGQISQKTEDLVGPYELHDFYLYYILRYGYAPSKIYRLAIQAFKSQYDRETILKWLNVFYRRFFSQQFKRSCLPDGPKVGSVAVSPRGDLRMPSDASGRVWLEELEGIK